MISDLATEDTRWYAARLPKENLPCPAPFP